MVAGSLAAGSGVGAPVQGRLVDRFGQRAVLPPLAFVHAAALGLLVLSTELGAPTAVLVLCGVLAGFAIPPTSSVLRSMWPSLLAERPAPAPARLRARLRADRADLHPRPAADRPADRAVAPQVALIVSAVCVIAGTLLFTALPPSRAWRPERDAPSAARGAR